MMYYQTGFPLSLESNQSFVQAQMIRTFFRRRSDEQFEDALNALQRAFQEEAARQEQQKIEYARLVALQERNRLFQMNPISWPATMATPMPPQHMVAYGVPTHV